MSRIAFIAVERRRRELERQHAAKSSQPGLIERILYFIRRKWK
jgi:hypothetical protein